MNAGVRKPPVKASRGDAEMRRRGVSHERLKGGNEATIGSGITYSPIGERLSSKR